MEKNEKKTKRMTKKQRLEAQAQYVADKVVEEELGKGDPIPKTDSELQTEADAEKAKRQAEIEAEKEELLKKEKEEG